MGVQCQSALVRSRARGRERTSESEIVFSIPLIAFSGLTVTAFPGLTVTGASPVILDFLLVGSSSVPFFALPGATSADLRKAASAWCVCEPLGPAM